MYSFLGVFLGGGAGASLRWLTVRFVPGPWGIFAVNVAGAFLIGAAYTFFQRQNFTPEIKLFMMTGLLGGFTTFSTYLLDFVQLAGSGKTGEAFLYLLLSIVIGLAALWCGLKCMV